MRKFLSLFLITLAGGCFGQTFTSTPGTAIPSSTTTTDNLTVTGIGIIDCDYGISEVCIDISHTYDADLDIFLRDPLGTNYLLTSDNGGSGNNYIVTCFDMTAVTNVTAGSAPFNGSFIPESDMGLVNNGQDANGTWQLRVRDDAGGDEGTLNSWSIVFSASPECGPPPSTADCEGGTTVCSDATFTGNSSGDGDINDLTAANDGCLRGEHQSSWYYFQAATDGDYAFTIETLVDYDFAVWGPLTDIVCPPVGAPLRCSYSGTLGDTGLEAGAGDTSEGAGGDAVVDPISALEDDIYVIVIDNFTSDGTSFDLTWTLSGGATFDCSLLPIELVSFTGDRQGNTNALEWITASEENNSHYIIERSTDGINWEHVSQIAGAGNSSAMLTYTYRDQFMQAGVVYYQLSQVDFDGKKEELEILSINAGPEKEIERIINLMGVEVDDDYRGLKIYIFTDGTKSKVISQ